MAIDDVLSVREAARELAVHPSRVRALLAAGVLDGGKVGGRWLVFNDSVRARQRRANERGRQLSSSNAWAALMLASGLPASWLRRSRQRYVQSLLDDRGLNGLASRMRHRAHVQSFYAHPGVLRRLVRADELVLTGASAAASHDLGLMAGDEIDAYIAADAVGSVVDKWALEPRIDSGGNVMLRALPEGLWPFSERIAPIAAVAVDLAEQGDPRSHRIGENQLRALDRQRRWADALAE